MALSSKEYWEKRSLERLTEAEKASIPYIRKVRKVYEDSARTLVESVKKMYTTYYREQKSDGTGRFNLIKLHDIAPSGDIKRLLTDMKAAGLSTRLPSYYKGRITRAKLLEAQMWLEIQKAAERERELSTESYKKTISHSYYRSIYDYSRLTSSDQSFSKLNDRSMNRILSTKFAGSSYSSRIWKSADKLAGSMQEIIGKAIATGQPLAKTTKDVRSRFDVKKYEAERLIRTETNYFENYAEIESYEEMEIDRFIFMATLDGRTSEICREMDGKIFKTKEAKQGDNVPPLHPYCRSTIAPYLGKEYLPKERRARDLREDGTSQVVKFQSFQSWAKEHNILQDVRKKDAVATIPDGLSGYSPTLTEAYNRLPIEIKNKSYVNKAIKPKTGRNRFDSYLSEAEIDFIEKLEHLGFNYSLIPVEPGGTGTNDFVLFGKQYELKTRIETDENTIKWAIIKATDKNKFNIILDTSYMNKPLTWVFKKVSKHMETNKNAHKIKSLIIVRGNKFIQYK